MNDKNKKLTALMKTLEGPTHQGVQSLQKATTNRFQVLEELIEIKREFRHERKTLERCQPHHYLIELELSCLGLLAYPPWFILFLIIEGKQIKNILKDIQTENENLFIWKI